MQNKSEITLEDYKIYSNQIVIEVNPKNNILSNWKIVNMIGNESLFHIYFDKGVKEQKRNFINK